MRISRFLKPKVCWSESPLRALSSWILILYIAVQPFHQLIAPYFRYSYLYLSLIALIFGFFILLLRIRCGKPLDLLSDFFRAPWYCDARREKNRKWQAPINFLIVSVVLFVIVLIKFNEHIGYSKILGAMVVPFFIGLLLSTGNRLERFGQLLFYYLIVKLIILLAFYDLYFLQTPRRPVIEGIALYLWLGLGMDFFVVLLGLYINHSKSKIFQCSCMGAAIALAFVLVGINSRSILYISVMASISGMIILKSKESSVLLLTFIAALLIFMLYIPGRAEHFTNMLASLSSLIQLDGIVPDKSTELRINGLVFYFSADPSFFGVDRDFVYHHHFLPGAIYYNLGLLGLFIYMVFCIYYIHAGLLLFSRGFSDKAIALFAASIFMSTLYTGNLFNSVYLFLFAGLMIGLLSGGERSKKLGNHLLL